MTSVYRSYAHEAKLDNKPDAWDDIYYVQQTCIVGEFPPSSLIL